MANLYVRAAKSLVGLNRFSSQPDVCLRTGVQLQAGGGADGLVSNWQLKFTGVPVVLLDLGGTKSRQQRRIQLIVAERSPAVLFLFVFCFFHLLPFTSKPNPKTHPALVGVASFVKTLVRQIFFSVSLRSSRYQSIPIRAWKNKVSHWPSDTNQRARFSVLSVCVE